jgi:putative endonuclease
MMKAIGIYGEAAAAAYLTEQGYEILATNWHCARGELDIVDRHNAVLVFVEVKTRRGSQPDAAFASVSAAKRERLIASAYLYLEQHKLDDVQWRIDVIAVALPHTGKPLIVHVEDALDW